MTTASRRTLIYWLLLLVPTLAVGLGAIQLLRREEARLAGQSASAGETRRAAVTARTALVVENLELLLGDVQAGLLESLAAMEAGRLDRELDSWRAANPLVRMAFRCGPDGRILHPLAGDSDEARGFHRRFAARFAGSPPWSLTAAPAPAQAAPTPQFEASSRDERAARQQADSNVAQVQNARRDAANLAKSKDYLALAEGDGARPAAAAPSKRAAPAAAVPRQGWLSVVEEGRLHLLGWTQEPASGQIRGVEVELAALIGPLGAALPSDPGIGEGYALLDDRGRVMHHSGWVPRGERLPAVRLPVAVTALPGWAVVAWLDEPAYAGSSGPSFLLYGSLLVGILVVAILAGGALLLWQARTSEAEAARKTSFVANVSHEFKTPLTTIRLYSELLEQGRVPNEGRRGDYLRTIGRETERLARLVGNALDFSRLEQGRKKFAREPLDLGAELGRLLDTHAPRLAEAGLRLERTLPAEPLPVTTDRDAVQQILLNLLDNAAKYAAAGGEVTVEAAPRAGGGVVVCVLDRGPGVPAGHREQVFEKFHQVDDSLTAGKTGLGLGLSIARQLARGLGGELSCRARDGDGGGAAFVLELP